MREDVWPLPSFLQSWQAEGLDVSQLPAWIGERQFDRRMETVIMVGTWL